MVRVCEVRVREASVAMSNVRFDSVSWKRVRVGRQAVFGRWITVWEEEWE